MAKKRKGRKGREPAGLRRWRLAQKKKRGGRKASAMARKKRRKGRRSGARRTARRGRRRGLGGGLGGGVGGIVGTIRQDAPTILAGAVYGFAERKAKADPNNLLNKVPRFIDPLGFTGNTAVALYAIGAFAKIPLAKVGARAVATIATYQMAAKGAVFANKDEKFTVSGGTLDEEMLLGDDEMDGLVDGDDDEGYLDGDDDGVIDSDAAMEQFIPQG